MELLIYKLIKVPVISVRDFFGFTKVFNAILYGLPTIYCIQLFISLFIIPSQNIIGKILPNLLQGCLEKHLFSWMIQK